MIVHIGPSKTASTSIQAIIPELGRPYLIKPAWGKALARDPVMPVIPALPDDCIVSDEALGDFDAMTPQSVSDRLYFALGRCVVVFIHRAINERLASVYAFQGHMRPHSKTFAQYRQMHERVYQKYGIGYYAAADLDLMRRSFAKHDFRVVDFNLLQCSPTAFLAAFCGACGISPPDLTIPHLNRTPT